jgi:hypothetical protein
MTRQVVSRVRSDGRSRQASSPGGSEALNWRSSSGVGASATSSSWLREWKELTATVVALDASPATVLRSMRGSIIAARIAYPDVLHVEVRDSLGALWRLATQDAEWSPSDPAQLVGRSIEDASIDGESGELRCTLSVAPTFRSPRVAER